VNLDQLRAATAYDHIQEVLQCTEPDKKRYGTLALKLPILVRTAGLCQALHFIQARGKSDPKTSEVRLLGHIATQLKRIDPVIQDAGSLCRRVRGANMKTYLHLTREATSTLQWYARLTRSILKIERTDEAEGEL